MTAKDIIESKPDILICTYKYLDLRKRLLSEYDSFHRLAELRGLKWADKLFTEYHRPNPCERVNAGILSPIFRDLGLRIKHVVLDEAQRISNEELSTHASIRELNYYSIFVLSGSFMSNRWHLKPRTSSTDPGYPCRQERQFSPQLLRMGRSPVKFKGQAPRQTVPRTCRCSSSFAPTAARPADNEMLVHTQHARLGR